MPKARALLIGGSEYGQGLTSLKAPLNDVAAMARVLQDPAFGQFDQVSTLIDPDPQSLRESVEELFCLSQKDDLALLFFSGHGLKDDRNRLYFATNLTRKTARGTLVKSTAVPASFVQDQMGESRSRRQVVILDCCFSGAFAEGMTAKDDGRVDLKSELGGQGRVVLTSSTSTQYAFENQDSDLSIYTHYIIQGITTGEADANADGYTAIDELHDYACRKLQESTSAMQPKIYAFDQGFKINIAKAPASDPAQRYRRKVETLTARGPLSVVGRFMLDDLRGSLGLSVAEAGAIETAILQSQREHQDKCCTYRQAVQAAIAQNCPPTRRMRQELAQFQELLGLEDTAAATICAEEVCRHSKQQPSSPNPSVLQPNTTLRPLSFETATLSVARSGLFGLGSPSVTVERRSRTADSFSENLGNGVMLTMMDIPKGQFVMGSSGAEEGHWQAEEPRHPVALSSFLMGQSVVTWAQWRTVATYPKVKIDLPPILAFTQDDQSRGVPSETCPVTGISWRDAIEFCQRLSCKTGRSYRLPSEAEWEYACRAKTMTSFHFGDALTSDLAHYDCRDGTKNVGSFPANAFGLYDMHGNVWEWCSDRWHETYSGAPNDGTSWDSGHESDLTEDTAQYVIRGGSWMDLAITCRAASRIGLAANTHSDDLGFRVVCQLP